MAICRVRSGAVALAFRAFIVAAPLAETACRSDDMGDPTLMQSSPKQRAVAAMDELRDFSKMRTAVFAIMAENQGQEQRFEIMRLFADRFKAKALEEIRKEALVMGSSFEDFSKLEKSNPNRFAYIRTLSYGLALFGEKGFDAAVAIVISGGRMRMPFSSKLPLTHGISTMAVYMLLNNKLIDGENALQSLRARILDPEVALQEKGVFVGWTATIRSSSLSELRDSVTDPKTRELIDERIRGAVPQPAKR